MFSQASIPSISGIITSIIINQEVLFLALTMLLYHLPQQFGTLPEKGCILISIISGSSSTNRILVFFSSKAQKLFLIVNVIINEASKAVNYNLILDGFKHKHNTRLTNE
jgi:hypothetical protein